ncbi:hypothetical protein ACFX2I_006287 [Malus domestica]
MLQMFYNSQDFFFLKELEKLGPKKGIISQSVKDVIQSLVDDDLVFKDKIGTSTCPDIAGQREQGSGPGGIALCGNTWCVTNGQAGEEKLQTSAQTLALISSNTSPLYSAAVQDQLDVANTILDADISSDRLNEITVIFLRRKCKRASHLVTFKAYKKQALGLGLSGSKSFCVVN